RIFNQTLNKSGNLSLNRYNQSKAKYYGVEGRIDYALTPELHMGTFLVIMCVENCMIYRQRTVSIMWR
ncbi:hypothetical protein AAUPMC_14845, partial [Pasteurella multocida subsp. multocida str. Anand1_cattle]